MATKARVSTRTATLEKQRKVQSEVDRADAKRSEKKPKKDIQTGARKYPATPMPKQHLRKPGLELNLGAVGKGYALDRAGELLRHRWGVRSALLHGGSSSVLARG